MVNGTVEGKINQEEKTMEVGDIISTSVRIIGLLLLLAGVLLLLLHLEEGVHLLPLHLVDVMNLGVVKHIESVKHFSVPTICTALPSLKNISFAIFQQ